MIEPQMADQPTGPEGRQYRAIAENKTGNSARGGTAPAGSKRVDAVQGVFDVGSCRTHVNRLVWMCFRLRPPWSRGDRARADKLVEPKTSPTPAYDFTFSALE